MLELVKAGGWPMIPLLLLSMAALAIIVERFWTLRRKAVLPPRLGDEVRAWAARGKLDPTHIESLRQNAVLYSAGHPTERAAGYDFVHPEHTAWYRLIHRRPTSGLRPGTLFRPS